MTDKTVNAVARLLSDSEWLADDFAICWHAGEPLTAGISFYERAVAAFAKTPLSSRELFHHAIQTNGILIDKNWCSFFKEHSFSIGVSIDGPPDIHNAQRRTWGGSPTHKQVMRGIELLNSYEMPVHAIAVLTRVSLKYPDDIFEFFLENGFSGVGFNVDEIEGINRSSTLIGRSGNELEELREEYAAFWQRMFELWWPKQDTLPIREFNNVRQMIKMKLENYDFVPRADEHDLYKTFTFTKNGDVVCGSPEFASTKNHELNDFVLGNVNTMVKLDDVFMNPIYHRIQNDIDSGIRACARECYYFDLCGGGTPVCKFCENGTMDSTVTSHCILHTQTVAQIVINALIQRS